MNYQYLLADVSDKIYKSRYGYFILQENSNKWIFTPIEQEFDTNDLLAILDILRNLNENDIPRIS
jgi:hypothetical protein